MNSAFFIKILLVIIYTFAFTANAVDNFQHTLGHIKTKTNINTQKQAAEDLIKRIVTSRAEDFLVEIDSKIASDGKEVFKLLKLSNGKVQIIGSSGVAAAWGFHHYLKYMCKAHISWETQQLQLPEILPNVDLTIVANDRFRYYQNVCTTSYSFVWWTWSDWEKHIDWMAMNGFNLVLAFNGQEAIWQRVYQKLNLTQQEIDEHFGGPAFLSWSRMGNLRGWGGPLSQNWHEQSLQLQKAILERMRSLGIIPVLPAFAGHLPIAFKRLYPHAKMTRMLPPWVGMQDKYCCPYLLEPIDPLFNKIGAMFIQEQIAEYGTDHIYNCDTFNEMNPSSSDPKYLADLSKAIFDALVKADNKAVWIMQGWLFYNAGYFWTKPLVKAFITAVPTGRMIILDLYSELFPQYERLESYFGQPYIWCMLHNFGGTLGMHGQPEILNKNVIEARNFPNSTMIGIGLTPEGINQNYVIYDFMIEQAWRNTSTDLDTWMQAYAVRRYGKANMNATSAWINLKNTVYANDRLSDHGKCVIVRTPRLGIKLQIWYNTTQFALSWDKLLDAADDLKDNDGYKHDVVDVTRQYLQILGDVYYRDLIQAFRKKQADKLKSMIQFYEDLFADLDLILSTNKAFLLGNWIESAKALAKDKQEKALFELNARNQLTLWGPRGEIKDYAGKQWSGLISHYFAKRWKSFMNEMYHSVTNNISFVEKQVMQKVFEKVELPFTLQNDTFPTEPIGDSITIAKELHKKWRSKIKEPELSKGGRKKKRQDSRRLIDQE